jgi:hypothetical protein
MQTCFVGWDGEWNSLAVYLRSISEPSCTSPPTKSVLFCVLVPSRWAHPPLDVLLADGLTAAEADALLGADGGLHPESFDLFLSAISDEFYDVYSDAYYDTGTL